MSSMSETSETISKWFKMHVTMLKMNPFQKQLHYLFVLQWTTKGGTQTRYLSLCPLGYFPFCHQTPCRWYPLEPQGCGLHVRQPRHWLHPQRTPSRWDPSINFTSVDLIMWYFVLPQPAQNAKIGLSNLDNAVQFILYMYIEQPHFSPPERVAYQNMLSRSRSIGMPQVAQNEQRCRMVQVCYSWFPIYISTQEAWKDVPWWIYVYIYYIFVYMGTQVAEITV